MDPAARLRALAFVAAAAGVGAAGCGGAPTGSAGEARSGDVATSRGVKAPGPGPVVTEGEPAEVHARLASALNEAGHACRVGSDRVLCKGEAQDVASFYVVYRPYPSRLLFGSPWRLKGDCASATTVLNRFNWKFDELGASCDDNGTLVVSGAYFVPGAGLTARDVVSYARWWTLAEVRALQSSELGAMLQ